MRAIKDVDISQSLLLLSTKNRYSAKRDTNMLIFRTDGDNFILAASSECGRFKPDWYLNLKEEPIVEVQVNGESFYANATTPTGKERLRLWPLMDEISNISRVVIPRNTAMVVLNRID